jgi:hypothetical protein
VPHSIVWPPTSCIGARRLGRVLLRVTDLVSPNANFGFVAVTDNSATSNYQALQVKFERDYCMAFKPLVPTRGRTPSTMFLLTYIS